MAPYPEGTLLTSDHLIAQVKQQIKEINAYQLKQQMDDDNIVVIDIREFDEYAQGTILSSHYIPRGFLEFRVENLVPHRDTPIALYCSGGVRSVLGARSLAEMGYTDVVSVTGGFGGWKNAGYPFVVPRIMTDDQRHRYSRHTVIPEVGSIPSMPSTPVLAKPSRKGL